MIFDMHQARVSYSTAAILQAGALDREQTPVVSLSTAARQETIVVRRVKKR